MAHMSLKAQDLRIFIKNGKLRLQAFSHDSNGEILDQVTIELPAELSGRFNNIEDLSQNKKEVTKDTKTYLNRIQNFILDDNQD